MNAFQILNFEGHPIHLMSLDAEAASFWGVQVNDDAWAHPYKHCPGTRYEPWKHANNWYDVIGFAIADAPLPGWQGVRDYILNIWDDEINDVNRPHLELINNWDARGYKPKQVQK